MTTEAPAPLDIDLDALIGSATFQVNLILWMTQLHNAGRVDPIFAEAGYDVLAVEQDIPLTFRSQGALARAKRATKKKVQPDLLLKGAGKSYLIVECKRTMFGDRSESADQAGALLVQSPREFEEALGMPKGKVKTVHLAYLSRLSGGERELDGVLKLRSELRDQKIEVIDVGMLGLKRGVDGITLCTPQVGTLPKPLSARVGSETRLFDGLQNPAMLYVIPWLPGSESDRDAYHKVALGERVKASAAEIVAQAKPPADCLIATQDVVHRVLGGYEKKWKNTVALSQFRQEVKAIVERQLLKLTEPPPIKQPDGSWALSLRDERDKDAAIQALFAPGQPVPLGEPLQLSLDTDVSLPSGG